MKLKPYFWPALIVTMLAANVAIVLFTMVAAQRGGGASVTPAYDDQALHWDKIKLEREQSAALGWTCAVTITRSLAASDTATMKLTLTDKAGQPIQAPLTIKSFHSGHPGSPAATDANTGPDGVATVAIPAPWPGMYTLMVESPATQNRAKYQFDTEVQAVEPAPSPRVINP